MVKELDKENFEKKPPILRMRGIKKHFGGIEALKGVDFEIRQGEIVSLIGDNGAGKSTLIKIICGVQEPDEGEVILNGKKIKLFDPKQARNMGIETIFQDLALFNVLDVTNNLFAGREITKRGFLLDQKKMEYLSQKALDKTGIRIKSLKQSVEYLSGGQKEAVNIARAVYISGTPKLILMDEPTAGLGVKESNELLKIIKGLKKTNKAVVLVTHNLDHAFSVADRFVVLRGGLKVGEKFIKETNKMHLVRMMVGDINNNHN